MIDYDPHRWFDHLLDIKGSVVRQILWRVLFCVAWSAVVVAFHCCVGEVAISNTAHVLIGLALSLLLVFRTNSSYDRFWEGRKQWGSIINETRNLARAASVLLAGAPDLLQKLFLWTMAFPYATMHLLRGNRGLGPPADGLPPDEVAEAFKEEHLPLAVARRMSAQLAEARRRGLISDYVQMTLDQNVQLLIDYMGACERIHKTPIPFAYMVHLRRALILYIYTLPLTLVGTYGAWTILVTLLLAYFLAGIEEIGVEIEDPFGTDDNDLPLERFCATIENNLRSVLSLDRGGAVTKARRDENTKADREGNRYEVGAE